MPVAGEENVYMVLKVVKYVASSILIIMFVRIQRMTCLQCLKNILRVNPSIKLRISRYGLVSWSRNEHYIVSRPTLTKFKHV